MVKSKGNRSWLDNINVSNFVITHRPNTLKLTFKTKRPKPSLQIWRKTICFHVHWNEINFFVSIKIIRGNCANWDTYKTQLFLTQKKSRVHLQEIRSSPKRPSRYNFLPIPWNQDKTAVNDSTTAKSVLNFEVQGSTMQLSIDPNQPKFSTAKARVLF